MTSTSLPPASLDPEAEARAEEFERRRQAEAREQFKRLKDDAQAIYGAVKGLPGVRSGPTTGKRKPRKRRSTKR